MMSTKHLFTGVVLAVLCVCVCASGLAEREQKLGTLEVGCSCMQLTVADSRGYVTLHPNKDGKWELPVGNYTAKSVSLMRKSDSGEDYELRWAYNRGGKLSNFTIEEGKTTTIKAGFPLTVKTQVGAEKNGSVEVGMSLMGCAGEEYTHGVIKKGTLQPAPTFRIKDRDGKVLAEGKFRYG